MKNLLLSIFLIGNLFNITFLLCAYYWKIRIEYIKFGMGFTLLKIKKFQFAMIPIGGIIKFEEENDEKEESNGIYYLELSNFIQALLHIFPLLGSLLIGFVCLGEVPLSSVLTCLETVLDISLYPLQKGDLYFDDVLKYSRENDFIHVLGYVSLYLFTLHILPLSGMSLFESVVSFFKLKKYHFFELQYPLISFFVLIYFWGMLGATLVFGMYRVYFK